MKTQQSNIALHDNPVKSWLIDVLLSCADELSIRDHLLQNKARELFSDDTIELPILADELYREGIVSLRAMEWMSLCASTRHLLNNCMSELRSPIWS